MFLEEIRNLPVNIFQLLSMTNDIFPADFLKSHHPTAPNPDTSKSHHKYALSAPHLS